MFVCGCSGPAVVVSFQKQSWVGASSHTIRFEGTNAPEDEAVKLARKTNTDPEKRPWLIYPVDPLDRLAAATAEAAASMTEEGIPP